MQTVVENPDLLKAAKDAGITADERQAIVSLIAENPLAGDLLVGTGGCRKLRVANSGRGKSGGYRTVHWFGGIDTPVVLLTIFGKGEKANLTRAECNALAKLTATLKHSYTARRQ